MITRENVKKNPGVLFVFGDNDERKGLGGFAKVCRGEPNSIGIRVKKHPTMLQNSFYTDEELLDNTRKIDEDIMMIKKALIHYSAFYIPDGIDRGLAELDRHAPQTYSYLKSKIEELKRLSK
jgi:hypothetical protein